MGKYYDTEMEGETQLTQYQVLYSPEIQLSLEPLEDPENCVVFFFCDRENGDRFCSSLKSLTDYLE